MAATAATRLFGETPDASAALAGGCFASTSANVCYSPWKVVSGEGAAGGQGVILRKGPSFGADPVVDANGNPRVIGVGKHFGRQSVHYSSGSCPQNPGPRANVNGFLWSSGKAFDPAGNLESSAPSGWLPYNVGGVTYAAGESSSWGGRTCGPCCDADCRYPSGSGCAGYNGCNSSGLPSYTCNDTYRPIVSSGSAAGDSNSEPFTLRYAPDGALFFWFRPGDVVLRRCYLSIVENGVSRHWSCVEAHCCAYVPKGCSGWIRSDQLGASVSPGAACYPSIACPS